MVYYSPSLHQPIPRNLLSCKREHTHRVKESDSLGFRAYRNPTGVTANYIPVTGVDCTSHKTHTQGLSYHCLYSFCRYSYQLKWCGVKWQSTTSKERFWIKRIFCKRAQATSEKKDKFGKASLQSPEDPCLHFFTGNSVSLHLPIIYFQYPQINKYYAYII